MMNQRLIFHHITILEGLNMINCLDIDCGTQKVDFQSKILQPSSSLFFFTVASTIAPPFSAFVDFQRPMVGGVNEKIIACVDFQCLSYQNQL